MTSSDGFWAVGADIGGTFTDLVLLRPDGSFKTRKVSSSVGDYAAAILDGLNVLLEESVARGSDLTLIAHGTTVATNAILEHDGAKTALLTTEGFRDVLELRRLRMPRLYDPDWIKPVPLVERRLRFEVSERCDAKGNCLVPLDEAGVERALHEMVESGVESLAVCFLHSQFNPAHELRVAELAAALAPQMGVSISSLVQPEIREYERTSTTVINAYVRPLVRSYLGELSTRLREIGYAGTLWVMQSNGGLVSAGAAEARPVNIVESGPAAGVVGALRLAKQQQLPHIITFDMGGTTAKASLIENGELTIAPEYEVGAEISIGSRLLKGGGYLLRVPAIDIAEVGAGGGSIVWIDSGGALRVGPRSAGASPGPAAYGLGGDEPTITDANIILGYLRSIAGGAVALDLERAAAALQTKIAGPLGMNLEDAALGARRIATSNMVQAVRAISIERGRDPREFALFAFGGNGPGFATDVASAMGITRVLIPPAAGVFSAVGLCVAPVLQHFVRSCFARLDNFDAAPLAGVWRSLDDEARSTMGSETSGHGSLVLRRSADVRFVGQSSELRVAVADGPIEADLLRAVARDFVDEHRRTYGHADHEAPIEIVNARVVASVEQSDDALDERRTHNDLPRERPDGDARKSSGVRRVYVDSGVGWLEMPVYYSRSDFSTTRRGPCVLELYDTTALIPTGWSATLDAAGNLSIDLTSGALNGST